MKYQIKGYDAYGQPVTEEIEYTAPPPPTVAEIMKGFVVRWTPIRMHNVWYRLGWTKIRMITRISVDAGNIETTEIEPKSELHQ